MFGQKHQNKVWSWSNNAEFSCAKKQIHLVLLVAFLFPCRPLVVHPEGCWEQVVFQDGEDEDDGVSSFSRKEFHSEENKVLRLKYHERGS